MQFVEAAHDPQILGRGWPGFVVDGAPADAERLGLPGDRQVVLTVDHRLALSNPALVSAPSKKSFSKVSSPILAGSAFKSTLGAAFVSPLSAPNRPAAPSSTWLRHCVTWFGCTSKS